MRRTGVLRRHAALPGDHGAWVLFLSPLLIGLFAGGRWKVVAVYLVVAALTGFLIRQPITLAIKIYSGRRPRDGLAAAWFWIAVYAGVGLLHVAGLVIRGYASLLLLAVPGVAVFAWYLVLVGRRAERGQLLVEVVASGVLALTAPAGLWVGLGRADPIGWLLWALAWAQSAASLLYAHLRLEQRRVKGPASLRARARLAAPAVALTTLNVAVVAALGALGLAPRWLFVAFLPQWIEALRGGLSPAVGFKPRTIGRRQLLVSVLFTVLFIVFWR